MSSSIHPDHKKKDVLVLGNDLAQRSDSTRLSAEKKNQPSLLKIIKTSV